jgi:hypothetical protein
MGPEPTEDEYDDLPFKLPPGPYSQTKPDLPYAAIIGQAILASPEHRLTLQEIYDYITIVFPHFKRNEQTWMNSIRHVLSTTIVFRKVQRDRAAGRTLWAIFDQDIDCFAGGAFRKEFCADMQEQREKTRQSRKRAADDTPTRKPRKKRLKTDASQEQIPPGMHPQMGIPMSSLPAVAYPGPPMFPGPRPGTHHQPYYTPYVMPHPHAVPAGVIFPVLPPGSVYNPMNTEPTPPAPEISRPSTSSSSVSRVKMEPEESPSPSLPPTSCSSVSLPELTPNNSSSSPTGEPDDQCAVPQDAEPSFQESVPVSPQFDISAFLVVPEDAPLDALAPGVTLLNPNAAAAISGANSKSKPKSKKGKESTQVSNLDSDPVIHDRSHPRHSHSHRNLPFPPHQSRPLSSARTFGLALKTQRNPPLHPKMSSLLRSSPSSRPQDVLVHHLGRTRKPICPQRGHRFPIWACT